ncbi:permease-like cell division protein FtsX [Microtetraspora niveoalba]|uniref:permease-like cell division protein FtsX n=1 Tax=Microtetraspora niveoalba TaxID=46175 RepID=UPI00082F7C9B|nr:permease-like cell division protein FtsX [Microtetraspora niveoalba]
MIEQRLREALSEAAATADLRSVRPLTAPRRRARSARMSRFVVIPAALVAAVSAGVFLLVRPAPPAPTVANPAPYSLAQLSLAGAGSWQDDVVVFLCDKDDFYPVCGKRAVTEERRQMIRGTLESLPEVESVRFETRAEAYENFRTNGRASQEVLDLIRPEDLPESFKVKLKPGADNQAVVRIMKGQPGVSNVIDGVCLRDRSKC